MNVKDKVILITGGAGGLGSEVAKLLASHGAVLFILDLPMAAQKANELTAEISDCGGKSYYEPMEGTSEKDWEAVVASVVEKTGRIDVLINNAGINIRKPIEEMNMEEWMKMMEVNTGSVFLGTKYVIPQMRSQGGGSIINTSSVCGLIGHRYTPEAYTATKGAVTLLSKAVASRYAKDGIRCNSINPSTVDTPLVQEKLKDPKFAAERLGEVPLGRLCSAKDVANAVLYLASDEAKFINGVAFPIDGGTTCC